MASSFFYIKNYILFQSYWIMRAISSMPAIYSFSFLAGSLLLVVFLMMKGRRGTRAESEAALHLKYSDKLSTKCNSTRITRSIFETQGTSNKTYNYNKLTVFYSKSTNKSLKKDKDAYLSPQEELTIKAIQTTLVFAQPIPTKRQQSSTQIRISMSAL